MDRRRSLRAEHRTTVAQRSNTKESATDQNNSENSHGTSVKRPRLNTVAATAEDLLTDPRSKLGTRDLKAAEIFSLDTIRTEFTAEERVQLLQLLPEVDKFNGLPIETLFRHNPRFNECLDYFQANLRLGAYTKEYQDRQQAYWEFVGKSQGDRDIDEEDEWKEKNFEHFLNERLIEKQSWGQPAGDSKTVTIPDLCLAGKIRAGDILRRSKVIIQNEKPIKITGEFKVMDIDDKGRMKVEMSISDDCLPCEIKVQPKGQKRLRQTLSAKLKKNTTKLYIFSNVETPTALDRFMYENDDRLQKPRGNSWRCIELFRNNKNLGKLFDIRLKYYIDNKVSV